MFRLATSSVGIARRLLTACILMMASSMSHAAIQAVAVEVTGTIIRLDRDRDQVLPFPVVAGDPYTLTYTYWRDTELVLPPNESTHFYANPVRHASVGIGSNTAELVFGPSFINISNNVVIPCGNACYTDQYSLTATQILSPSQSMNLTLVLTQSVVGSPTMLTSADLITPTSGWSSASYFVFGATGNGMDDLAYGSISSVSIVSVVPLPASVWLLVSALAGLFRVRRRTVAR